MMSSFPLVSFLITLLLAAAVCIHGQEPVKDTAGNPVKAGEQYFIQPASNNGGGLVPAAVKVNPVCPLGITQSLFPYQPGQPVSFEYPFLTSSRIQHTENIIETFSVINIEFKSEIWPVCNEFSKLWEVDDSSSGDYNEPAILIGGKADSGNSWFQIEKAGQGAGANTYKLNALAGTVGTAPGIFGVKLVITYDDAKTLLVKFKKVDDATASTSRVDKLGLRMFPSY